MAEPQAHFNLASKQPRNNPVGPLAAFCLAGAADLVVNLCVRPALKVAYWPPERRKTLAKFEALASLWKGELPMRIKGLFTPAISYGLFHTIRDILHKSSRTLIMSKDEASNKTTIKVVQNHKMLTNFLAGALAGYFTGCITHPWQRFTYLHNSWRILAYEVLSKRKQDTPLTGFKGLVGPDHSILSLYRWFTCGSILSVTYYSLLFGLYHSAIELSLSMQRSHQRTSGLEWIDSGETVTYLERSFYAMGASMIARTLTFPCSKVLSIMHSREGRHYKSTRECLIVNWKLEGPAKFMLTMTHNMSLPLTAAFTLVLFDVLGDKLRGSITAH
jgi:hypothetical protein